MSSDSKRYSYKGLNGFLLLVIPAAILLVGALATLYGVLRDSSKWHAIVPTALLSWIAMYYVRRYLSTELILGQGQLIERDSRKEVIIDLSSATAHLVVGDGHFVEAKSGSSRIIVDDTLQDFKTFLADLKAVEGLTWN